VESEAQYRAEASKARDRLVIWLRDAAYPFWSTRGTCREYGGFQESVDLQGNPLDVPRRGRVQPRQIFSFAKAPRFGWSGDASELVSHGLAYFLKHYRRPDGLFRTLVAKHGAALDHSAVLYDQAFALLAFAAAHEVLGPGAGMAAEADRLRGAIGQHMRRPGGGFYSSTTPGPPLQSNPHMHLLESSLAWAKATGSAEFQRIADEIGEIALAHFIDPVSGALRESFRDDWSPAEGLSGRIVEPGHQLEWAFLLMSWKEAQREDVRRAAVRLIDNAEQHGVRNGVAINALLDDFSIHDGAARLWPQTERLRAATIAARLIGGAKYWKMVCEAATGLERYFDAPVPGIWQDQLLQTGEFRPVPVPAGNLYHIVGAIEELDTCFPH
jgi:mannose/cellobiose epimerase-like protein (N-acyl-D-glucosamine 2-epimerase family)